MRARVYGAQMLSSVVSLLGRVLVGDAFKRFSVVAPSPQCVILVDFQD